MWWLLVLVVLVLLVLYYTPVVPRVNPKRQLSRYNTQVETRPSKNNYVALATVAANIYTLAVPNTVPTPAQIASWAQLHGLTEPRVLYSTETILNVTSIRSQPIGLIGKMIDNPSTALMVFRGSQTTVDWIYNVKFIQSDLRTASSDFPSGTGITTGYAQLYGRALAIPTANGCTCASPCVNSKCLTQNKCGQSLFGRYYDTCTSGTGRSLGDSIKKWVLAHPEVTNYMLTGHSLGGAPAILAALHLRILGKTVSSVYTFASPRVGSPSFVSLYNSYLGSQTFRFVAVNDPVPSLPLTSTPLLNTCFQHVGLPFPVEWWSSNATCNLAIVTTQQHRAVIDPSLFELVIQQLRLL